jgi:POTRA domain, FtsQ-type
MMNSKLPISRAILWILLSTLFISGSAFMGWQYYLHMRGRRLHDDQYRIVALIQSTPQADSLKSVYLAELLDLSIDRPINLYQFNAKEGAQTLRKNPLIKEASIKKILPGTLFIDYQMRVPIATIGDFANTVMDEEGFLFPYRPFFTPKNLPTIYLGLENEGCRWGSCVKSCSTVQMAFDILCLVEQLQQDQFHLKQLDMTQVQCDSYGQRQIVMMMEEERATQLDHSPKTVIFLRLSVDHAAQDLGNFRTFQKEFFETKVGGMATVQERVFDFRIPHLAFIAK